MLFGPVHVPGAEGGRWLADNDGRGFRESDGPIHFRREACRTRLRQVRDLADRLEKEGMPHSDSAAGLVDESRSALEAGNTDRGIEKAFWAGEKLVEDEVAWRLARECRLDLGINTKGLHNARPAWDEHFAPRFNYATIPATWSVLELEKDRPRFDVLSDLIGWCKHHGMRMKAHALIWHNAFESQSWWKELDSEQLMQRSSQRVRTIVERFGNDLDAVEVANEPMQANAGGLGLTPEQEIEETVQAYEICREVAPHLRTMISFYAEDESWFAGKQRNRPSVVPMAGYIDRCRERGVRLDLIGLQYHLPHNYFNLRQVAEYWHTRYGVPVHITELTPPSGATPSRQVPMRPRKPPLESWRGRPWTEQVQAEYVRAWLDVFRALPFVENATFWGTTDAPILWHDYLLGTPRESYRLPWAAGQGLLREDLSAKPALYEVK